MSSRGAAVWMLAFAAIALVGGGELELLRGSRSAGLDPGARVTGRAVRVIDGDTVRVRLDSGQTRTVRYIGIDTPETVKPGEPVQCFGEAASRFNERLVAGRRVRLRIGREPRDRYGRTLAYVYLEEPEPLFVDAELVRLGYARTLAIAPNTDYAGRFAALERQAKRRQLGLWRAC